MGQPFDGFPEPLCTDALRGRRGNISERVNIALVPADFASIRMQIASQFLRIPISECDIASYIMFPDVYKGFRKTRQMFGDLSALCTPDFLCAPDIGQKIPLQLEARKLVVVEILAV